MKATTRTGLKAAAIVLAGVWVYASLRHAGWLWDDDSYITGNLFLRSAAGLKNIWFHPAGLLNYFPLTFTVQWLQWQAWGDHPLGYHATNLALHLLSAFLLWRLLSRLGSAQGWLAALIFTVHPVAVESVAWASELKNTLSLPPLLLALDAYFDFEERGSRGAWVRSWLWFLIAMLCKSTVAMFPLVLLLYSWWREGRIRWRHLQAAAPFFAVSLVLGLVEVSFEHQRAMLGFDDSPARGLLPRAAAAGLSLAFYFCKIAVPAGLLPTYPRWAAGVSAAQYLPWLGLLAVFGCLWTQRAGWGRHALFALGFFYLNLAPVAGFVPMAYQRIAWVADHFAYLSLAGLAVAAAAGIGTLAARTNRPAGGPILAGLIAAAFAWESRGYAAQFASREKLWTYTLRRNPDSWAARNDLGNLLLQRSQPAAAAAEFSHAIRIEPDSVGTHNNLAAALIRLDRPAEAIAEYDTCLRLGADYPEIHYNLGMALERVGRLPDAIGHYEKAIRLNPAMADARANLGAALAASGRLPEAIGQFEQALRLNPSDLNARSNFGQALGQAGRWAEAIDQFERVRRANPEYPDLHFNLAAALLETGRIREAEPEYRSALRAKPADPEAHYNLGLTLRALGREAEAQREFDRAAALRALR